MRFRRGKASEGDPAGVPTAILGAGAYGAEALRHGLRTRYILALLGVLRTSMAAAWGSGAGLLSERSHDSISFAVRVATTNEPILTRLPSLGFAWLGQSCVGLNDRQRTHVLCCTKRQPDTGKIGEEWPFPKALASAPTRFLPLSAQVAWARSIVRATLGSIAP